MLCLLTNSEPPDEAELWLHNLESGVYNFPLEFVKCNLRVVRLCAKAQEHFISNTGTELWVLELLQLVKEAILVDQQYQECASSATGNWSCKSLRTYPNILSDTNSSREPGEYNPSSILIYHDIWVAWVWNNSRGHRIHLHEVLLEASRLLDSNPYAKKLSIDSNITRDESSKTISDVMSDICSSIPFCLGDINSAGQTVKAGKRKPLGGYLLLVPLHIVRVSAELGMEAWVLQKLEYISDVMGIRTAGLLAAKPKREPWKLS
jgi:hypothetical protein